MKEEEAHKQQARGVGEKVAMLVWTFHYQQNQKRLGK
jgi:hypothetical protein